VDTDSPGVLNSNLPLLRSEPPVRRTELEIVQAVPHLLDLLDDPDDNTRGLVSCYRKLVEGVATRQTFMERRIANKG
jgi:hypothetical protein